MKSRFWISVSGCVIVIAFGSIAILGLDSQTDHGKGEPKGAAIHWAKGQAPGQSGRGGKSPNLTYHGGPVMQTTRSKAIFWGTSWASYSGDKISGVDSFYAGLGASTYAGTTNEFADGNGPVTSTITYAGHVIDTSAATGGNTTGPILAEVCRNIESGVNYYPVYVDLKRGNAGYCAWHSYGTCGGQVVQFAFFFNLDADAGCDPNDPSGLHSQGLAAVVNVSGHEISEARTDPRLNAWYDSSGDENSDKCAWTFSQPLLTLTNGSQWKIQGNWSNYAYNSGTGYPSSSGLKGCIDGGAGQ